MLELLRHQQTRANMHLWLLTPTVVLSSVDSGQRGTLAPTDVESFHCRRPHFDFLQTAELGRDSEPIREAGRVVTPERAVLEQTPPLTFDAVGVTAYGAADMVDDTEACA